MSATVQGPLAGGPPDLDEVRLWLDTHAFNRWLGLEVVALTPTVTLRLSIADHMRYISGMLHGGMTATLLDTALGIAARLALTKTYVARTARLETVYLAPGRGNVALVEANVALADGVLTGRGVVSIDGVRVGEGVATFAVVPRRQDRGHNLGADTEDQRRSPMTVRELGRSSTPREPTSWRPGSNALLETQQGT